MSEVVYARGLVAVLKTFVADDQHEAILEKIQEINPGLSMADSGEVVYWDQTREAPYSERTFNGDLLLIGNPIKGHDEFMVMVSQAGLEIDPDTIKPFHTIWYNGCEGYMCDLTAEKVLQDSVMAG
jgi:hypothetical protein